MSVHLKLTKARVKLSKLDIKKTGHNKFSGYYYYELGDFMPHIQSIFEELGLCGTVSFGQEMAVLTIVDAESGQIVEITSPMSEANLKGMHPVQNLGAVQTYIRRYLWTSALEITESDAIDSTAADVEHKPKPVAKKAEPKVEKPKEPEVTIPDGMSILEFADQMFAASASMDELKPMFAQLWKKTKGDEQTVILNLYNARKAELEA
ncbi:ERF family protein [Flavobacterium sp.]|jgi:hypothetical protein|uniref:ERF family protein n=1 Tax=Flavobacterium sp. TaxID=239 RepID=UPI0037BEF04C